MVRVMLVVPPLPQGVLKESVCCSPPLNVTYLAAILERAGFDVKVADCPPLEMDHKSLGREISSYNPDIVGIISLTQTFPSAIQAAQAAKEARPEALIVLGGPHATFMDIETINSYPCIDVIVRGEGEKTLLELAENVKGHGKIGKVAGITFRKNGKIVRTPNRPFIENLDELPFPAYHFLPLEKYGSLGRKFFLLLSSRGCPFQCSFCTMRLMDGGKFRPRNSKNVVDEIEYMIECGAEAFSFCDETFTLDKKRVYTICEEIRRRKVNLPWDCQTRVDQVSREILIKMKEAGCQLIGFGVESGSQKILDAMRKGTTVEENEKAIKLAKEVGLPVAASFMLGYPGETYETVKQTFEFIHKAKPDIVYLCLATPFPGTDFYNLVKEKGWKLSEDWVKYDVVTPVFENPAITAESILEMRKSFYDKWYSVSYILRNILNDNYYNRTMARFAFDYIVRKIKQRLS